MLTFRQNLAPLLWISILSLSEAVRLCKLQNYDKVATFSSLLEYQSTKRSFDPDSPTYQGNVVEFDFKSVDKLPRNAFVTFGSSSITKLILKGKGIRKIEDGAFAGLFCLHLLDMSKNNVTNLTMGAFNGLENLRHLDLSENALGLISERGKAFNRLFNLKMLNLSHNAIKVLNEFDFFNLTNLEVLDLSHNKLNAIPPSAFQPLSSLKELYLDHNRLSGAEPQKWKGLLGLQVLSLSGNFLSSFDPSYNFSFANVRRLNLSDNSLSYLNVDALRRHLPKLLTIDVSYNRWRCEDLESIRYELADSRITVFGDGNCNYAGEYKEPTTTTMKSTTSLSFQANNTETSVSKNATKEIFGESEKIIYSNNNVAENVKQLQTLVVYLGSIIIVFFLLDIAVRIGVCNIYNRMASRRGQYLDSGSDREHLVLLRR